VNATTLTVGAVGWAVTQNTAVGQAAMAALAKSGFTAAFALIFVSELGDKTFFIAVGL
jgi:putative Ca2+/H+ antiporter (TMEM165/GDT1 family)